MNEHSRLNVDDDASVGVADVVVEIPIESIDIGGALRVRAEDAAHTQVLANTEAELPPILVHRSTMRLIDGAHRLKAAKLKGAKLIRARFFDGTDEEAFVLAVQANIAHGLPLSILDRKAASLRIMRMYPLWSDRKVAEVAGLDHKTVGAVRRQSSGEVPQTRHRLGRDGRMRRVRRPEVDRKRRPKTCDGPEGGPATPEPAPADRVCHASVLQSLRRDPSLRLTETGRTVLRWLDASPRTPTQSADLADRIPEHCLNLVLDMARQNAANWQDFATRIGDRLQCR
ncbi:ParB/RepB/Spo0J family partition protein [Nocardia iowensis]|uniref:ParB/RepB/Spo0J family partition protein n=1 Tax=Nocardia iowensis TaxID=204891 RepID=A0ABX8RWK8_NOCIO|nr:ParB/RepB/Spo0J family partition protein [Nocardia iowensis]QXN94028.1 ParB/RepB/Spo0J family partition protein [Nocardia iowensis]